MIQSRLIFIFSLFVAFFASENSSFTYEFDSPLSSFFEDQLSLYGQTFDDVLDSDSPEFLNLEKLGVSVKAKEGFELPWIAKVHVIPELHLEWGRE